jgi:hypothetical protein
MRDLVVSLMALMALQEGIAISERTKAGPCTGCQGRQDFGRRAVVDVEKARQVQGSGLGLRPSAKKLKVSVNTLARALRAA